MMSFGFNRIGERRGRGTGGYSGVSQNTEVETRVRVAALLLLIPLIAIVVRLVQFQIIQHDGYAAWASDQHDLEEKLLPTRGRILVRDPSDGKLYPLATNREAWTVFAVPKNMKDPIAVAHELAQY